MKKELQITNAFLIAALAAEAAACSPQKYTSPVQELTPPATATFNPDILTIKTPTQTQISVSETPTNIPEWQKPLEERFMGTFDLTKSGFTETMPASLLDALGFTDTNPRTYEAHNSLGVTVDYFPTEDDGSFGTAFEKSAQKDGGRTPLLFLTDRPNIKLVYAHSGGFKAPGEPMRIIGSFLVKHPEKVTDILGKQMIFTTDGGEELTGTIVFAKTVGLPEFYDQTSDSRFWSRYEDRDNIIFFMTDRFGIPDVLRNDQTPGVSYLIFVSCSPKDGADLNINPFDPNRDLFNGQERSFVVFRFVNP